MNKETPKIKQLEHVTEIQLRKLPVRFSRTVPALWQEGAVKIYVDEELKNLFIDLESFVWAEPLQEEVVSVMFHTPATAWQLWKAQHEKWLPKWFKKKFPITLRSQERKLKIERLALFPQFCYAHPEQKYVYKQIISEVQ